MEEKKKKREIVKGGGNKKWRGKEGKQKQGSRIQVTVKILKKWREGRIKM